MYDIITTQTAYCCSQHVYTHTQSGQHSARHPHVHQTNPSAAVLDTLIWQGLASVIIPGFTINRVCAFSRLLLSRRIFRTLLPSPVLRRWTVTAVGLGCIPFIIEPIDRYETQREQLCIAVYTCSCNHCFSFVHVYNVLHYQKHWRPCRLVDRCMDLSSRPLLKKFFH